MSSFLNQSFLIGTAAFYRLKELWVRIKIHVAASKEASLADIEKFNTILWEYAINENADSLPNITIGGVELPPVSSTNNSLCSSRALLIPNADLSKLNCTIECRDRNAQMLIVRDTDTVSYHGHLLEEGVYCTSTVNSPPPCNRGFGMLVLNSTNVWECLATVPLVVAGPNANTIIAGSHPDVEPTQRHLNRLVYGADEVPYDFDVTKPIPQFEKDPLWKMKCGARTTSGRAMYNPPGTLACLVDHCADVPMGASYWNGTECVCVGPTQHIDINDPTSMCTSIPDGYDATTRRWNLRSLCYTSDTLVVDRPLHMPPCVNDLNPMQAGHTWLDVVHSSQTQHSINEIKQLAYSSTWKET